MPVEGTPKGEGASAPSPEGKIYRCEYCKAVVLHAHIADYGGCKECGSRKVRVAFKLTDEEVEAAKAEGYVFHDAQWTSNIDDAFIGE